MSNISNEHDFQAGNEVTFIGYNSCFTNEDITDRETRDAQQDGLIIGQHYKVTKVGFDYVSIRPFRSASDLKSFQLHRWQGFIHKEESKPITNLSSIIIDLNKELYDTI